MKTKTDKMTTLKRTGIAVAIAAGLTVGGAAMLRGADDVDATENKEYFKDFEKTAAAMTQDQKLRFLQASDEVLQKLQQTIDSDETNPEERFDARRTYKTVSKERDIIRKKLGMER